MAVNYQFVPMCYLQARFEAPLGGATAVEDLRESFGFEGELAQLGSPTEQITSPFRRQAGESSWGRDQNNSQSTGQIPDKIASCQIK